MPEVRSFLPKIADYPTFLDAAWQDHLKPKAVDAPTVISLFAGCGGSSLGYSMAGFRELLAVEWDDNAVATFRLNFPDVPVYHGDICKLTGAECMKLAGIEPGQLDVLDGSPPCQGFSTAGKRQFDDSRNQLYLEYVRLLRELQPRAFIMENVSGMVKGKMKLIFADILRELKASGYQVSARLLDACWFGVGVPQYRQRMIFIGLREGEPSHPGPKWQKVTVREAWRQVEVESAPRVSPGLARVIPSIPIWGDGGDVTHSSYFGTKRLAWDRPSRAIIKEMVGTRTGLVHPEEHRVVTLAEAKRLASYPDGLHFNLKYGKALYQIGNSVPPLFMCAIAEHVKGLLS